MDRSDEKRDQRIGDVLGLGGPEPGEDARPHASQEPDDARKRRARMQEGAESVTGVKTEMPPE